MHQFEYWTIAYRHRHNQETLLDDTEAPFSIVKNTWRYWAADPHIVEHEGTIFSQSFMTGFCAVA